MAPAGASGDPLFQETWEQAARQGSRLLRRPGDGFPHVTDAGRWRRLPPSLTGRWGEGGWAHGNWTAGFGVGVLWRLYERTRDSRWAEAAAAALDRLAPRADDGNTHDIGFLFWPSAALGADLTGDRSFRRLGLRAARTLAGRRQPGGYLAAWGPLDDLRARQSSTIDTMMNLPLLWWTGDAALRDAARTHAETAVRAYLRADGSTCHTVRFDPATGAVLERGTFQGLAAASSWSRGQAWAIAGFARAWRETGEPAFRDAAARAAEYFLARLAGNPVPAWDFADPDPSAPRDSSAAVIAAAGLLDLDRRADAVRLLTAVLAACLNRGDADGLLLHACYSRPHNDGVDCAAIWGDYFCLTCLARLG
jgi:unsaturated chondroitin disaccharide hydrolase